VSATRHRLRLLTMGQYLACLQLGVSYVGLTFSAYGWLNSVSTRHERTHFEFADGCFAIHSLDKLGRMNHPADEFPASAKSGDESYILLSCCMRAYPHHNARRNHPAHLCRFIVSIRHRRSRWLRRRPSS